MLGLILLIHVAVAVVTPVLATRLGRGIFLIAAAGAATSLAIVGPGLVQAIGGEPVVEVYPWAVGLDLTIELRLDAFAALMVLLVVGVQLLVTTYAFGYFSSDKPGLGRFAATFTSFAGAMLGLVLSDHLLLVFAFWELTSITSYLLIGTDDRRSTARAAALQALLTTALGGLAMLAGFVILGSTAGTYQLSALLADPPSGGAVPAALVLVLLGAFTKSAQVPFHSWLPGAMAAPTPVSSYLHSATMVKAGVYLIARFAPAFADVPIWRPLVLTVGAATMLVGGWRALRQHDLKLVLAYGTISQLGFLTLLFGAGDPELTLGGTALLLAHAAFKASLFMTVGIVDHYAHSRDLRRLTGLARRLPITAITAVAAGASMAGLPPLFGFVAKEAAFEGLIHAADDPLGLMTLIAVLAGSILTTAYTARYVWGAFATKSGDELDEIAKACKKDPAEAHAPSWAMQLPAALLALFGVVVGILPMLGSPLVVGGAMALDTGVEDSPLALWHGFNLALGLSTLVIALGITAWVARRRVERLQTLPFTIVDAGAVYTSTVNGTLRGAKRVVAVVQSGSLPIYLGIIVFTAIVIPGARLALADFSSIDLVAADHPMQLVIMVVIVTGALATCILHRRFAAVIALGAVGYGLAVLFVLQGAPDLALTQLLIETLVLVLFVLVLRHLPEGFRTRRWRLGQGPRLVLAGAVGVGAMVFSAVAVAARQAVPVSAEHIARAVPEGDGRNVVNVTLVDFRGFDTFGEIVVLTATALGVVALVRAAQRDHAARAKPKAAVPTGSTGVIDISQSRRSVVLETGVRIVYLPLILFSIYLTFAGHNQPGGGFIGGLVAGAALILIAVSYGADELKRRTVVAPEVLLGGGIAMAALSAAVGWLTGGEFLSRASTGIDIPVFGELYLSTTATFDLGVYFVVVGLVVAMLQSLGSEEVSPT